MKQNCIDVFSLYQLPFETYILGCINHDEDVHEDMELVWVIKGTATITIEKKEYLLTSDTVFMIYMNQRHSICSNDDTIMISFRLKKDYILKHRLYFEKIPFNHRVYTFYELAYKYHEVPLIVSQLIRILKSDTYMPEIRYKIIGYYNMYIYNLYSVRLKEKYLDIKKKNTDPYLIRINKIIDYIYTHFYKNISLDDLSELTSISNYRLSHFIKEALGISFKDFLQDVRFDYAISLLKKSNLPVLEIVKQSGFSDIKYFNKMLKDKFHMTALQYRKIVKDQHFCQNDQVNCLDIHDMLFDSLIKIKEMSYTKDTYGFNDNFDSIKVS